MRPTLPVSIVLILLAAALLAACAPASAAAGAEPFAATVVLPKPVDTTIVTQASQLVGVWQVYDPQCAPGYMIIRADGTYTWSCRIDGVGGVTGKYHFSHGRFVVLNDLCAAEGQYRVNVAQVANPRAVTFSVVQDDCSAEIQALTAQRVTWVSPLP